MATPTTIRPSALYSRSKVTSEELRHLLSNMRKKAYTSLLQVGTLDTVGQVISGTKKDEVFYAGPLDIIKGGSGGYDVLMTSVSIKSLASSFEALQLAGSAKIGNGNGGHNNIIGNKYANVLNGKGGNDVIVAGAGNDKVVGGLGNDVLFGGAGSDLLYGGVGSDRLKGGAGSDRLYGQDNNDILDGGAGNDRLYAGTATTG
jgi:Ca2+-binding RTX toxin-like protein